jgi:hypothetical protein
MPTYQAVMRVVHLETWEVEAKDEAAARAKLSALDDDVTTDDTGGEVTDWEVYQIKPR